MSIRTEKVSEEIKHQVSSVLSKDLAELRLGLVTVTKVIASPDLLSARIYLSFIGNKEPTDVCLEKVNGMKKQIRMHLASKIKLKNIPELNFYFDDTTEYANRIEELIKEIHKNPSTSISEGEDDKSSNEENA